MIKIRAWDKKSKKMIYFDLNNIYGYEGEVSGVVLPDGHTMLNYSDYADEKINENLEFMLCSPWEDKNENKIYEGDLLKRNEYDGYSIGIVKFEKGSFVIDRNIKWDKREFVEWPSEYFVDYKEAKTTIIGNKYENPELIE